MTVATLTRPTYRPGPDGLSIRRVVTPSQCRGDVASEVVARIGRLKVVEKWARLELVGAVVMVVGIFTYNLAPFVGYGRGFTDATLAAGGVTVAFMTARAITPSVTYAIQRASALCRSLAWWLGLTGLGRQVWLPPLPTLPLPGLIAVVPWHGRIARDGVIVRRTRLARHVDWVLLYDRHEVIAVARVVAQVADHPGVLARHYGPKIGLSARSYRSYTAGHARTHAIILDLAYRPPYPVTLPMVGITGPLGSHRYIGGVA